MTVDEFNEYVSQTIKSYDAIGHHAALERFVQRNATPMRGSKRPAGVKKLKDKECFKNSAEMALHGPYSYHEGIAVSDRLGILIHHAWNMVDGAIVDTTWKDPEDCIYLGIEIPRGDLIKSLIDNRVYGIFDLGLGLNIKYMFKHDPELEKIVSPEECRKRKSEFFNKGMMDHVSI